MSDIYKEALADAKKLREVAELDAKNRIIEKVSPFISEMISRKINEQTSVFIEQEDDLDLGGGELDDPTAPPVVPPTAEVPATTDPTGQDGLDASLADAPVDAPIAPSGTDLMNVSVPDENGMITVDFNDLFAADGAAVPALDAEVPQPVPADPSATPDLVGTVGTEPTEELGEEESGTDALAPIQPESISYRNFINNLNEVSSKIDRVYFTGPSNDIVKESLKTKLFTLVESLDSLVERGAISSRQAKINENKLEFFYLKLKEAGQDNSYNIASEKNNTMKTKTLREFAAELYEEELDIAQDTANSGKTGVPTDKSATAQAKRQSGVSPAIGGHPSDIEASQDETHLSEEMLPGVSGTVDADNINDVDHGEKQWADGEARLKEATEEDEDCDTEVVEEGAEGFGDTSEQPAVEFEVNDKEIAEAVRAIRKENIRNKMRALKEAKDEESWEDGEPEGGTDPSQKNLKEQAMEDDMDFGADDMGMEDDSMDVVDVVDDGAGDMDMDVDGGADLVLNLDLPDELEALLADFDASSFDVDVSMGGSPAGEVDMDYDSDGDDEVILVDDTETDADPVVDSVEEGMYESRYRRARKAAMVNESKVQQARKLLKNKEAQISELKEALESQNLFTAKAVYLNKFLMREGLSKKAMRQIVEHLDRAKTLAEAKTIYTKIKLSLDKHLSETSSKLAGSASRVTTPGSAKLTESVSRTPTNNQFEVSRWQQIAGIKAKK